MINNWIASYVKRLRRIPAFKLTVVFTITENLVQIQGLVCCPRVLCQWEIRIQRFQVETHVQVSKVEVAVMLIRAIASSHSEAPQITSLKNSLSTMILTRIKKRNKGLRKKNLSLLTNKSKLPVIPIIFNSNNNQLPTLTIVTIVAIAHSPQTHSTLKALDTRRGRVSKNS